MGKVFGIGWEDTGSETLAACMRTLGYHHAGHDSGLTRRVIEAGDTNALDDATEAADSFAGEPWHLFYRRLDRLYPDARFILTVRHPSQAWFESLRRHAEYSANGSVREQVFGFARSRGPRVEGQIPVSPYDRHARQVQEYFAGRPERLLVLCWEQERSWERLCAFLGQPLPDVPLPHESRRRAARVSGLLRRVRNTVGAYAQRLFPTWY